MARNARATFATAASSGLASGERTASRTVWTTADRPDHHERRSRVRAEWRAHLGHGEREMEERPRGEPGEHEATRGSWCVT